ncbi:MAG TPA: hypothetical protein VGE74_13780 [Gemmata sp.]
MAEAKFDRITARALRRVRGGSPPEAAWVAALRELYAADKVAAQEKHTCPKWAFGILCHRGHVRGVQAGCCPSAESSSSAAFALAALDRLLADPSLAEDKRELKRLVFGEEGAEGYRTPNDEVEVLLALWASGDLTCCTAVA